MKFSNFHSSSKGNFYCVENNAGGRILLECGVPWKALLTALNFNLSGIEGCFLTHEHKDHSKSVRDVISAGIDVYGSKGTLDGCGLADEKHHSYYIENEMIVTLPGFQVLAFKTHHDAAEPLGFLIRTDDEFMLFATDTSHLTQRFAMHLSIIAIEASYDRDILNSRRQAGLCHETVARRLLTSHMEWHNTMRYIRDFCCLDRCREIHLLHMSSDNINNQEISEKFEHEFFVTVK